MKKITCVILFLATICKVNGTVHTVSNDANKPADFNSVTAALTASSPGDTLYIYGTSIDYGDLTIDRSITLIGAGFNTRKEMFNKSRLDIISFATGTVNNVELNGITCVQLALPFSAVYHYSNITIRNCNIANQLGQVAGNSPPCGSSFNNWLIENSYLGAILLSFNTNCGPAAPATSGFLVRKSIISSMGGGGRNMNFANCSFGLNGSGCTFSRSQNCIYDNCIFFNTSFDQSTNTVNNVFNNCLTYQTTFPSASFDLTNWTNGGSGTANNCIINQNPLWAVQPDLSFFNAGPSVSNSWDPSISGASPAHNAGTDGTDIGLTGSLSPYNFHAEPLLPVVRKFQLVNASVPSNGTVTIKVTATKAQ